MYSKIVFYVVLSKKSLNIGTVSLPTFLLFTSETQFEQKKGIYKLQLRIYHFYVILKMLHCILRNRTHPNLIIKRNIISMICRATATKKLIHILPQISSPFHKKILSVKLVVNYDVIMELSIVTSQLPTNFTLTIFL